MIAMPRLDEAVAALLGVTRSQAHALVMEGRVRVDGRIAVKAGMRVRDGTSIEIERPRRYVGRGGEKLEAALRAFALDVRALRALDVGASTGGFTDCLLQHGAASVVALDVGYGQLDWRLRTDPRVRVLERTNFRTLGPDALRASFPDGFDIVTIDASFISLRLLLPNAAAVLHPHGAIVALVKPQFEAGRDAVERGGVVRDPAVRARALRDVRDAAASLGLAAVAVAPAPRRDAASNAEFFVLLRRDNRALDDAAIDAIVGAEERPA